MKKKLFCVIACLFMSIGLMRPSCAYTFSCGVTITTVCATYFLEGDYTGSGYARAYHSWVVWLNADVEPYYCDTSVEYDMPAEETAGQTEREW